MMTSLKNVADVSLSLSSSGEVSRTHLACGGRMINSYAVSSTLPPYTSIINEGSIEGRDFGIFLSAFNRRILLHYLLTSTSGG